MNKTNAKLLWLAIGISIVGTVLFYQYLSKFEEGKDSEVYREIIIAKQNIEPYTKITSGVLGKKKVNVKDLDKGTYVDEKDIVGKYAKDMMISGEPVRKERLVSETTNQLAVKIPEGKRAVSIEVNEYIAVGDLIQPSNYVDIYMNMEEKTVQTATEKAIYINQTKLILQNIQVLAVSKQYKLDEKERDKVPQKYSITLAVNALEAEKLIYSENFGTIKLALRPVNDSSEVVTYGVNEVSMRNMER